MKEEKDRLDEEAEARLKAFARYWKYCEDRAMDDLVRDLKRGYTICSMCGKKIIMDKDPEEYLFYAHKYEKFYNVCEDCNKSFSIQEQLDYDT